ncbi:MAG TPA: hypothetical protein VIY47_13470, partial [Ignavibacteriaceae bacterium]
FIYRLENASVYYLYLQDKEEDWITYVFKQAEKIDYTKKDTRTEPDLPAFTFEEFESMFTKSGKWHFAYTRGEKLGTQKWKKSKTFPVDKINADWKENYYITDISYGGIGNEKEWFVTSSKTKYTTQLWKLKSNTDELKAAIEEIRKTRPEHFISHIAYGDDQWVLVASKGTGYTNQTTIMSRKFPEENIKENWKTDYYITDMAYGGGWWTVVMSKGSTITKQHFHIWDSWDQLKINNEVAKGDYLTEAVKQGEKWYMLFSMDKYISAQDSEVSETIPEKTISNKWGNGYSISRSFYY